MGSTGAAIRTEAFTLISAGNKGKYHCTPIGIRLRTFLKRFLRRRVVGGPSEIRKPVVRACSQLGEGAAELATQ